MNGNFCNLGHSVDVGNGLRNPLQLVSNGDVVLERPFLEGKGLTLLILRGSHSGKDRSLVGLAVQSRGRARKRMQ